MRYRCPICSFEFIGGGFCPSPYHVATMMEELPELQVEFGFTCYNLTGTVIYETKQFITPKWCPCERRNNESQ